LVDRHQDYRANGDEPRHKASQQFFEKLGLLKLLGGAEVHSVITGASATLLSVHNSFNNFYNEPPFAERLANLALQNGVPESAQYEFVKAVVTSATGNPYGISHAAVPHYEKMIKSFSPLGIRIMFELAETNTTVGNRINSHTSCKKRYAQLVKLLDASSIPTPAKKYYEKWLKIAAEI
jgi:hypothetical protein